MKLSFSGVKRHLLLLLVVAIAAFAGRGALQAQPQLVPQAYLPYIVGPPEPSTDIMWLSMYCGEQADCVATWRNGTVYVVPFNIDSSKNYSLAGFGGGGPGFEVGGGLMSAAGKSEHTLMQAARSGTLVFKQYVPGEKLPEPYISKLKPNANPQQAELVIPAGAYIGTVAVTATVGTGLLAGAVTVGLVLVVIGVVAYGAYLVYEDYQSRQSASAITEQIPANEPENVLTKARARAQAAGWLQVQEEGGGKAKERVFRDDAAVGNLPPGDPCGFFRATNPDPADPNKGSWPSWWTMKLIKNYRADVLVRMEVYDTSVQPNQLVMYAHGGIVEETIDNVTTNYGDVYINVSRAYEAQHAGTAAHLAMNEMVEFLARQQGITDLLMWFVDIHKFGKYACYQAHIGEIVEQFSPSEYVHRILPFSSKAKALGMPDYMEMLKALFPGGGLRSTAKAEQQSIAKPAWRYHLKGPLQPVPTW